MENPTWLLYFTLYQAAKRVRTHRIFVCNGFMPVHKDPLSKKILSNHDDVIKWKHFPRNWPFVREIHRSPVNFLHKGQWRGALMFTLIYAWINDWVNNREAGDLRRQHGHYDVIVMFMLYPRIRKYISKVQTDLFSFSSTALWLWKILSSLFLGRHVTEVAFWCAIHQLHIYIYLIEFITYTEWLSLGCKLPFWRWFCLRMFLKTTLQLM